MPWTAADAARHKKGLSKAQAKKWASVANSVREDCLARKGKNCDAVAIRIASSQTKSRYE